MQLRIGGYDYTVEVERGLSNDGALCRGLCDADEQKILLCEGLHPQHAYTTLWHEIIHALCDDETANDEEDYCRILGRGIVQVLRDNPWLATCGGVWGILSPPEGEER